MPTHPPPLDPDAAMIAAATADMPPMRERGLAALRRDLEALPFPPDLPVMAATEDRRIDGPSGAIPLRIHRPALTERAPVLV
ncbi:alpha/beta hydrolase, partial [Streptomyces sp. MCAF7]